MEQVQKLINAISSSGSGVVHKKGKQKTKLLHKKPTLQEILAALLSLKGKKKGVSPGVIKKPRHMTLGKLHKKVKLPKVININIMDKPKNIKTEDLIGNLIEKEQKSKPRDFQKAPGSIYQGLTDRAKKVISDQFEKYNKKSESEFEQKEEKKEERRRGPRFPITIPTPTIDRFLGQFGIPALEKIPEGEGRGRASCSGAGNFIKHKEISTPGYITGLTLERKFIPAKPF